MFGSAYKVASGFTRPVIISKAHHDGTCSAGIGSFIIVNDDGWILTACHIVKDIVANASASQEHRDILAQVEAVKLDTSIVTHQKNKKIRHLSQRPPKSLVADSAWWAGGGGLEDVTILPDGDLAVARLVNFDKAGVTNYPTFKDPTKAVDFGTSLCRMGFPFHPVQPEYSPDTGFNIPANTFPMPVFPNEGILTRVLVVTQSVDKFVAFIETSSPGLPGQSGGPIFDKEGTVWGIQSHTTSIPLGFKPQVPGAPQGQVEHQFLNVGRGTHPATIVGLLKELGIKHQISAY